MAAARRFAFRQSMLVRESQRLTGTPQAMLAARRSMWRSPLPHGRRPASRAVIAAGQSVLAMGVGPGLVLVPAVVKGLVKRSPCHEAPRAIRRLRSALAVIA